MFSFLLRRADARPILADYLAQVFEASPRPTIVTQIIEKVVANYAQSVAERRRIPLNSMMIFQPICLDSGEHFLSDLDIFDLFCQRLVSLASPTRPEGTNFYLNVLGILFLELATADCPIDSVTSHYVKWLLRTGAVNQLQQLFLNGFLSEKLSLAIVFCELGSSKRIYHTLNLPDLDKEESLIAEATPEGRRECLQIGLEFLKRIKHLLARPNYVRTLGTYLIENHKIAETITLIQTGELELSALDVKKLLLNSKSKNSNYPFHSAMAFLNQQTSFRLHAFISSAELERIIKM